MLDFFDWIIEFFETVANIVSSIIDSFLTAFSVLTSAVGIPVVFTGIVPEIILTAMISVISLAVIKFMLGR